MTSAPELHRQMGMSISQAERLVLILCGRGTTGHAGVDRFHLDQEERSEVARWIESPPDDEGIDPTTIPAEHRKLFIDAARAVLATDGVTESEFEGFQIFEELTR